MGLFLTMGFSFGANAFWWEQNTVTCTATNTFTMEIAGQTFEFTETWEGTKRVCRSGDSFCLSSNCS